MHNIQAPGQLPKHGSEPRFGSSFAKLLASNFAKLLVARLTPAATKLLGAPDCCAVQPSSQCRLWARSTVHTGSFRGATVWCCVRVVRGRVCSYTGLSGFKFKGAAPLAPESTP
eukprot:7339628-Prymnesium_polylepis.2